MRAFTYLTKKSVYHEQLEQSGYEATDFGWQGDHQIMERGDFYCQSPRGIPSKYHSGFHPREVTHRLKARSLFSKWTCERRT